MQIFALYFYVFAVFDGYFVKMAQGEKNVNGDLYKCRFIL